MLFVIAVLNLIQLITACNIIEIFNNEIDNRHSNLHDMGSDTKLHCSCRANRGSAYKGVHPPSLQTVTELFPSSRPRFAKLGYLVLQNDLFWT